MQQEILETSSYPEIVYEGSGIPTAKAGEGQYSVTLNGDTHPQMVPARVALTALVACFW